MNALPASLDELINALKLMPGVGRKSAQRIALHLMNKNREGASRIQGALSNALKTLQSCERCQALSDSSLCHICTHEPRNNGQLCVVESVVDMISIEESMAYKGRYFVLNGRISPLDGIGPTELNLPRLKALAEHSTEVILAISPSIEGEATAHFIMEMLKGFPIKVTRIAYGVPFGGELEYLDQKTLFHAFSMRSMA